MSQVVARAREGNERKEEPKSPKFAQSSLKVPPRAREKETKGKRSQSPQSSPKVRSKFAQTSLKVRPFTLPQPPYTFLHIFITALYIWDDRISKDYFIWANGPKGPWLEAMGQNHE
jgi:hypothetical protein